MILSILTESQLILKVRMNKPQVKDSIIEGEPVPGKTPVEMFRFTLWGNDDVKRIKILNRWRQHFDVLGVRTAVRQHGSYFALYREGEEFSQTPSVEQKWVVYL